MPRDYKNAGTKKGTGPVEGGGGFLSFLSGLSIGLLVAFAVLIYQFPSHLPGYDAPPATAAATPEKNARPAAPGPEKNPAVPQPTFDFYHILPNREVNISEWVAEESDTTRKGASNGGVYILQVGSFKTFDAADQIKAQLALLGMEADIQRVVINGQDIRHRVRLGPYRDTQVFEETRRRLLENDLDFMVLKLKIEENRGNGG
ncbi:MAG: SPOR domain-containing protein [Gammaproteobacteria bacterium]|nr:SPOR domain-containing protein [Gammaproteobacteria bacterium]